MDQGSSVTGIDGWPAGFVTGADRARFGRYAEALAFYDGEQWTGRPRRGETRLTFNYARSLVRKIASYIYPAPVTFAVPVPEGSTDAAASRAERLLAATIDDLDLARLDVELCVDAMVLGDAAIKVTWDVTAGRPAVAAVDPATLVAWTAPDDPRRLERVAQCYRLPGAAIPASLGGRPGMERHGERPRTANLEGLDPNRGYAVVEEWTTARWRVRVAGQVVLDGPNPYGWIPYLIAPNAPRPHDFWGVSDLTDLVDVCRELNARMSVLSRVLELSGAPIAVLENVDGSEGITVGPGAKWELPEGAKAYLLDLLSGGGVGLHVEFLNLLYRALHDLSETPRTAFGDSGRDLSGAALEVEIQPLVQKVQRKRRGWDALHRGRNALLFDLLERFGGADAGGLRRTLTIWPSVLPSDKETAVRNAASLVAGGIQSRRTAVATLGANDPEAEFGRVIEEARLLATIDGSSPAAPVEEEVGA